MNLHSKLLGAITGVSHFPTLLVDQETEKTSLIAKAEAAKARRVELVKAQSEAKVTGDLDAFHAATEALKQFDNSGEGELSQFVNARVEVIDRRIAEIKQIMREDEKKIDLKRCAAMSAEVVSTARNMAEVNARAAKLFGEMQQKYAGSRDMVAFESVAYFGICAPEFVEQFALNSERRWSAVRNGHITASPPAAAAVQAPKPSPAIAKAVEPPAPPAPAPKAPRVLPAAVEGGTRIIVLRNGLEISGFQARTGDELVLAADLATELARNGAATFV